MYIVYSGPNDKYASAAISTRDGKKTRNKYEYLGLVVDREKGIYRNRKRGLFTFDPQTGSYGNAPGDFIEPRVYDKRRMERVSLDFGDAFFLHSFLESSGFLGVIDSLGYGNRDTLHAMVLFYILSSMANCNAENWLSGSIASLLYPRARLDSPRISEFLASVGTPEKQMRYQQAYLDYVMNTCSSDKNILIDSSGLPNAIHMPLTRTNVHNGKVGNEVRLIFVVQKMTGLPLFYMAVPGNVVDVSTLRRIMLHLESLGIEVESCIIDAGYNSAGNLDFFYDGKHACRIGFLTRVKANDSNLKTMIAEGLATLESRENFVNFEGRYLFIRKKRVLVGSHHDNPAFLYLGLDCSRLNDEQRKLFRKAKKTRLSLDEVYETMSDQGLFAILSGTDYSTDEILPAYYQRQAAEQIFDFAKNCTKLLPLRTHSEETFRGHLILSYIATCAVKMIQMKLGDSGLPMGSRLSVMRNQKCTVYPTRVITDTPVKEVVDTYAAFGIQCPESIPLVEGMLVYSPPAAVAKGKQAKPQKPKGKPGRPRKNPLPEPSVAPKKRGRPRKNPMSEQSTAPKKRGRPRKNPV
jgi:hypothetical protein